MASYQEERDDALRRYLRLVREDPRVVAARTPDGRAAALVDCLVDDLTRSVAPAAARAVADGVRRAGERLVEGAIEKAFSALWSLGQKR